MTDVPWIEWYQSLAKPSWTPAPRTIGLIWQVLYPVIIATFGFGRRHPTALLFYCCRSADDARGLHWLRPNDRAAANLHLQGHECKGGNPPRFPLIISG